MSVCTYTQSHQDIYGSSAHFAVSIEQVSRHEFLYQTGQDFGNAQADIITAVDIHMAPSSENNAFENDQNVLIHVILHMRKVS